MASTLPNMNYLDPNIGNIAGNLATAIYGEPGAEAKNQLYASQMSENQANAEKYAEQTRGYKIQNDASAGMPTALGQLLAQPQNFRAKMAALAPYLATMLQAGGGNADQMTQGMTNLISTILPLSGRTDDAFTALASRGVVTGPDYSPNAARADAVSARNASEAQRQAFGVANINQRNENYRYFNPVIKLAPGETDVLTPEMQRRSGLAGKLYGAPTKGTVQGALGQKMQTMIDNGQEPSGGMYKMFAGGEGSSLPMSITTDDTDAIMANAYRRIPGATKIDGNNLVINTGVEENFGTEKITAARQAAAQVMRDTHGDSEAATDAVMKILYAPPGTKFDTGSSFWRTLTNAGWGKPSLQRPSGTPAQEPLSSQTVDVSQPPPGWDPKTWSYLKPSEQQQYYNKRRGK